MFEMFSSFLPNWICILIVFYLVNKIAALDCYICGGDEPNNYPCTEFQSWDSKYIKACEGNSQSCRISQRVKDKMILSRSCENIKLNDCKTANAIEFCYCTDNLCNKLRPSDMIEELDDKEDESIEDIEGSGSKNVEHSPFNPYILATITSTEMPTTYISKLGKSGNASSDPKHSSSSASKNNIYFYSLIMMIILSLNFTKQY